MKAVLTLSIDIDDSGDPENAVEILHENLGAMVQRAMAEGLITGDSELLVTNHQAWIQVDKNA